MFGLGAPELLIVLVLVLVLFGGAKLPKLARSLGQAKKEFETGIAESHADPDRTDAPRPEPVKPEPVKQETEKQEAAQPEV